MLSVINFEFTRVLMECYDTKVFLFSNIDKRLDNFLQAYLCQHNTFCVMKIDYFRLVSTEVELEVNCQC